MGKPQCVTVPTLTGNDLDIFSQIAGSDHFAFEVFGGTECSVCSNGGIKAAVEGSEEYESL